MHLVSRDFEGVHGIPGPKPAYKKQLVTLTPKRQCEVDVVKRQRLRHPICFIPGDTLVITITRLNGTIDRYSISIDQAGSAIEFDEVVIDGNRTCRLVHL